MVATSGESELCGCRYLQDDGATPLYVSSQVGHYAVVAALLASGAAVNQATTVGRLSCSVYVVYIGVVELSERTRPTFGVWSELVCCG